MVPVSTVGVGWVVVSAGADGLEEGAVKESKSHGSDGCVVGLAAFAALDGREAAVGWIQADESIPDQSASFLRFSSSALLRACCWASC